MADMAQWEATVKPVYLKVYVLRKYYYKNHRKI